MKILIGGGEVRTQRPLPRSANGRNTEKKRLVSPNDKLWTMRKKKNTMTTISTSTDLDLLSLLVVGCDFDKYSKYSQHYYQIDRVERDIYQDIWVIVFGLLGVIRTNPSLFPVKIASSNEFIIFSIFIVYKIKNITHCKCSILSILCKCPDSTFPDLSGFLIDWLDLINFTWASEAWPRCYLT